MTYLKSLRNFKIDQQYKSNLGTIYTIVAIESSGYLICRDIGRNTKRIWCDVIESWTLVK